MKLPLILAGDVQGSVTYVVTPFTKQRVGGSKLPMKQLWLVFVTRTAGTVRLFVCLVL